MFPLVADPGGLDPNPDTIVDNNRIQLSGKILFESKLLEKNWIRIQPPKNNLDP